ncbi:MAG: type VI secretion system protein TssA [Desulfuromonadales bacterium]|nr:type VI secretion system protein TssA [Desulfuromonadales bacterium]
MKRIVDFDAILAPIPGDNPSGEELRYTQVYDDIREARRADAPLDMGDWQREIKTADWDRVLTLTLDALETKSKDLQIAVWLAESLVITEGFGGLEKGLRVITGLLEVFWDTLYPEVEDGDLEYRIAPLEFLNDKVSSSVRQVPLTEPSVTAGYSLLKWKESRDVGYEGDAKNKYGDVDEQKKRKRDDLLAEGRISAEDFDIAVARTSLPFFRSRADDLAHCRTAFNTLDALVDEKFGSDAPRLSDLGEAIEECERLMARFSPAEAPVAAEKELPQPVVTASESAAAMGVAPAVEVPDVVRIDTSEQDRVELPAPIITAPKPMVAFPPQETALPEEAAWEEALRKTDEGKFREALDRLLALSNSQPSERGRNRYRFLVAKLCLKAERPDLALPIVEQLHAMIAELQLERWESPLWVAEVLEALYQCLMSGEPSDENMTRGNELFRRICTMDVTKALVYRK